MKATILQGLARLLAAMLLTATIVEANRRSANTAAAVGRFKHAPVIARTASAGRAPQLVGVEGAERGRIAAPRFVNV